MNNLKIEISWGTLWRIVAVLSVVVAAFLVRNVLINLFLAFIISSGINPFIDYLENLLNDDYRVVGGYVWDEYGGYWTNELSDALKLSASYVVYSNRKTE